MSVVNSKLSVEYLSQVQGKPLRLQGHEEKQLQSQDRAERYLQRGSGRGTRRSEHASISLRPVSRLLQEFMNLVGDLRENQRHDRGENHEFDSSMRPYESDLRRLEP